MNNFVLVAGGLGYIGSHVVLKLNESGYNVLIVDNLSNSYLETFDVIVALAKRTDCQIVLEIADLTDYAAVYSVFSKRVNRNLGASASASASSSGSIFSVIALAGLKSVPESIENPVMYYQSNLTIISNLLKGMQEFGCYQLIFSSSATVYGELNPIPYQEEMPTGSGITNPYGYSKYLIELMLTDLCRYDKRWNITILRYFNPVGSDRGMLGDNPKKPTTNFVPSVMKSLQTGEPVTIFGDKYPTKDGTAERDFIHVKDLADAHVLALIGRDSGCRVYNVGLGFPVSVKEVLDAFQKQHIAVPYKIGLNRPGDLPVYYANISKIKQDLGWKPKYGLTDIINDLVKQVNAGACRAPADATLPRGKIQP